MVLISPPPPALSPDLLEPFYTTDDLLSNAPVLVFYGATSTQTVNSTAGRVQVHIYSPAGLQSYPRLTISPSSPLYAAVDCLAREDQGDEVCRALAFSLYKYFLELSPIAKSIWESRSNSQGRLPSAPPLFGEAHAALLAARMARVENAAEVVQDVRQALAEQAVSWLDVDVVLPPGSVKELDSNLRESILPEETSEDVLLDARYGEYAPLVKAFGEPTFLPTSRLRRAPSKPTGLSRSSQFSRQQKENLRRELCEFIDTEENYVGKVYDLLHSVAEDFRQKARNKGTSSSSPSEEALEGLFPPSLDEILNINTAFLEDIRRVIEGTENDAIQDIEATTGEPFVPEKPDDSPADVTGTLAFAKCLVEWFPKFSDCYTDYIQAHAEFGQYLRIFLRETGSSFSKRVQETGEQRLMSMLIEPVQRLPRYSLYIDNLVKQLPVRHPALKPLLKARDIISEICSRDSPSSQLSKVIERLQHLIPSWPQAFRPEGRLITAMDVVELAPPYRKELKARGASPAILLLFADELVLLIKSGHKTMSARGLLAEIDNPSVPLDETPQIATQLIFLQHMRLNNIWFDEVDDGSLLQLYHSDGSSQPPTTLHSLNASSLCMFYLTGSYELKASRWLEETVKARVEYRFPEVERESHKWDVRSHTGDLNLFSAIFEEGDDPIPEGRQEPARIRVVIDPQKGAKTLHAGDEGVELIASVAAASEGFYWLEIEGMNNYASRDKVTAAEFLPVLSKRVSNYLQMRNRIQNPAMTPIFLLRNQQILQSLKVRTTEDTAAQDGIILERAGSSSRRSPTKVLSKVLGSSHREGTPRRLQRPPPVLGDIPKFAPNGSVHNSPYKSSSRPTSRDDLLSSKTASKSSLELEDHSNDPLVKLEETLATYILSLHARKGNVVGRVIRNRANANELAVNELYNSLLEEPTNVELASQQPVDVLFRSFEKFLQVAWRERLGLVVPIDVLSAMQSHPEDYPGDFEEFFRKQISELMPQNQRALRASIKLLADLLAGTGNDGDRGMITAAFAEVLVPDGNSHDFISLLDRFIEDIDTLFGRPSSSGSLTPSQGSMNSRYGSKTNVSMHSNSSSLKRRFGLKGFSGLSREHSKSDIESKVSSVWRTLSKAGRNADGQASSLSKATPLLRSHSTDQDARASSPKRPGSRDRPTVMGAFSFEEGSPSRTLATIGEARESPRRKRRSSLSDLPNLQEQQKDPHPWSGAPQTPRRIKPTATSTASPNTPSPPKPSGIPNPTRIGSPVRKGGSPAASSAIPRPRTSDKTKVDSPAPLNVQPKPKVDSPAPLSLQAKPKVDSPAPLNVQISPRKPRASTLTENIPPKNISAIPTLHRPTHSASNIPTIPLAERPSSGNRPKTVVNTNVDELSKPVTGLGAPILFSPTRKLRMQSPQKLRERLQREQNAIQGAENALQNELSKIGDEITNLPNGTIAPLRPLSGRTQTEAQTPGRLRPTTPKANSSDGFSAIATLGRNSSPTAALVARLASLEARIPSVFSSLQERTTSIAGDVASSLQVSEARAKRLDDLFREATAENEALYGRFNDELARILRGVKGGDGVEEMRRKLRESQEETERLRKENWRLKRENLGLRAQLKDG
ncbi:Rho guanyl nucleotide exchange factor [Lasiodiplodia theobromae]|uniref:Rho guanine nucleotide exchange factor 17 n=1 Tax=Lasiodiplodia theobromae TaxID=45133 RepID=A0A5N5DNF2_9PEZI|nr:Rho guanyl nucleotide exchange factor [Lasiodiplodia theobromae]KAB2578861.1 Rho guanine nucleotide exchange factor 17 [Lasiodiplodia theobromae]KAF4535332.1 Rho guanyl nucleotide exchange factor [Lasiodiplodia theobromae]